jgi:hypothetical protein
VNFLFVAWAAIDEQNAEQAVGAGQIIGMRLETDPRLERLETLGASGTGAPIGWTARLRRDLGAPRELAYAVGMGLLAVAMCALLLAVSLAMALGLLLLLWKVLAWIFPTTPRPS